MYDNTHTHTRTQRHKSLSQHKHAFAIPVHNIQWQWQWQWQATSTPTFHPHLCTVCVCVFLLLADQSASHPYMHTYMCGICVCNANQYYISGFLSSSQYALMPSTTTPTHTVRLQRCFRVRRPPPTSTGGLCGFIFVDDSRLWGDDIRLKENWTFCAGAPVRAKLLADSANQRAAAGVDFLRWPKPLVLNDNLK